MKALSLQGSAGARLIGWCVCALMILPTLPLKFAVIGLVLFAGLVLIRAVVERQSIALPWLKYLLVALCALYFLRYTLDVLHADNATATWKIVERRAALLVIPLLFLLAERKGGITYPVNPHLVLGVALTVLCLYTGIWYWFNGVDLEHLSSGGQAFAQRRALEKASGLHPTYFGMLLAYSAVERFWTLWNSNGERSRRVLVIVQLLVFLVMLLALAARGALLALIIAMVVTTLRSALPGKYKTIGLVSLIGVSAFSAAFVPSLNERLRQLATDLSEAKSERMILWSSAWKTAKGAMPFGTGVEELQKELNTRHAEQGELGVELASKSMNAHNEYLHAFAVHGVLGVGTLLLILALYYKGGSKSQAHIGSMVIIGLLFLTENVLDRQVGIYFFGMLVGLHVFSPLIISNLVFSGEASTE